MRPVRRLLVSFLLVALVVPAAAVADHLDPQKRFNPADQARARAMLLRTSDFPASITTSAPGPNTHITCDVLSESDLTLTGEARSRIFENTPFSFHISLSQVYATEVQSRTSWRRGTSSAGLRCVRETFRRDAVRANVNFVSFDRLPFPRLAQQSVAFRTVGRTRGVRIVSDLVLMRHGRGQAALQFTAVGKQVPKAEELRLARLVAERMRTAMS
jgi:hypothetical protein